MKLRIIAAVLLVAVIAGAIWGAGILREQMTLAQETYEAQVLQLAELDDQAAQLQKTLDGMSLDDALKHQEQADQLLREAEDLAAQLETLRQEIEQMKTYLEENQAAIAEAEEEMTYLQGVYDELKEGLAKVEGYISGN